MASKLEALPGEQYAALIEELRALAGKPTLAQIQEVAAKYGVSVSKDTAWRFAKGPFARAIERINAGRETREALCAAAGAGVHPLDAIEEATVVALQDHLTEAETIDIKFVVDQLTKLRASISMREKSRREQAELVARLREIDAKLAAVEQQMKLRDEQIAKLREEARARAEKAEQAKAALATVTKRGGLTKDSLRKIEEAAALL